MKISLITVAYNSEKTIASTFDSVSQQNYEDLEYIVVDGGSTDKTVDIAADYSSLISSVISEPDHGIYDAMNKGIRQSSGEIVGILNSDDFFIHDKVLEEVASCFIEDPSLDVVFGGVDFVDDDNLDSPVRRYRASNFKPWMFYFGLMPPHPAAFVRKTAYDRVGLYKLGYKIAADFDFLTRLTLLDRAKYRVVNNCWVRMRTGGASTAGLRSNLISTGEMRRSLKENGLFGNLFMLMCRLPFKFIRQVISN